MSKETMMASDCPCGQRIQFVEQHLPHCTAKTAVLQRPVPVIVDGELVAMRLIEHGIAALSPGIHDMRIGKPKRASASNTHAKKGSKTRGQT